MAESPRRFLPPWRAEKTPHGYVVRDANGQQLVYVYGRATLVEAMQAKVLTVDEARRDRRLVGGASYGKEESGFVAPIMFMPRSDQQCGPRSDRRKGMPLARSWGAAVHATRP
jgi:hypothetical protein